MVSMNLTVKTLTFELEDDFYVDIVRFGDRYEAWLYHKNYGYKLLMFGVPVNSMSSKQFLDMVVENVNNYKDTYYRDVMAC